MSGPKRRTIRYRPRYPLGMNVFDAAKERIRWLFDEFDGNVGVSNSGGKDSTVVLELTVQVAKELGAGPVRVVFLDQECEFEATIDYQRYIMSRKDEIKFDWYQIPFRMYNAGNHDDPWLRAWDPDEEWVREKEPDSIHESPFKTDRFVPLLREIGNVHEGQALLTGIRVDESPNRRLSNVIRPQYKWATWASSGYSKKNGRLHYKFNPIYDWTYSDVWKAIHDNDWVYNVHYDRMYQWGVSRRNMRVSNYHHETALPSLMLLQETEPETWERATRRLAGLNAITHIGLKAMPRTLPYMFSSWVEYMEHLRDNLVPESDRAAYTRHFTNLVRSLPELPESEIARQVARAIVTNDLYGTSLDNWKSSVVHPDVLKRWQGRKDREEHWKQLREQAS